MYALIELEDRDWVDIESMMEETKGVISFYPLEKDKAEKILKEMN